LGGLNAVAVGQKRTYADDLPHTRKHHEHTPNTNPEAQKANSQIAAKLRQMCGSRRHFVNGAGDIRQYILHLPHPASAGHSHALTMKVLRIILLTATCLSGLTGCRQDPGKGKAQLEYDSGGNLVRIVERSGNQRHGQTTEYYLGGNVKAQLSYRQGQLHGRSLWYDERGRLKEIQHYAEGKLNGRDSVFETDGRLISSTEYDHGQQHGTLYKYDASGKVRFTARYVRDSLTEVEGVILQ